MSMVVGSLAMVLLGRRQHHLVAGLEWLVVRVDHGQTQVIQWCIIEAVVPMLHLMTNYLSTHYVSAISSTHLIMLRHLTILRI